MPFKANAARRHHIPKQKHQVTNWAKYDAGLRARGSLTVWFTPEAVEAWKAEPRTGRGGQPAYSALGHCQLVGQQGVRPDGSTTFRLMLPSGRTVQPDSVVDDLGREAVAGVGGGPEGHLAILAQPLRSGQSPTT